MTADRAARALEDVVAVERIAPGMVRVVTWADAYTVDARDGGCTCPDKEYNLDESERCKHEHAAVLATSDLPSPWDVADDLTARAEPEPVLVTDGGTEGEWTVIDRERDNRRTFESRSAAEDAVEDMRDLGVECELAPPGVDAGATDDEVAEAVAETGPEASTDGGESVEAEVVEHGGDEYDLPERDVGEDPLKWVPGSFVDEIDGTEAINRKGFEVLSHFYDVDVESTVEVAPEDTDHEYCRVHAVATTPEGRHCEAHGSAHVDRDDDHYLLLEMADTRARKRALSIATGVGAVAIEELKNEVA